MKALSTKDDGSHLTLFYWCREVLRPLILTALLCLSANMNGSQTTHRQKRDERHYDLTIVGGVYLNDGIGRQSTDLIETLKDPCRISFIHTVPPNKKETQSLPQDVQDILETSGKRHKGKVLIYEDPLSADRSSNHWEGPFWQKYGLKETDKQQVRIAYSMFESSKIPKSWVTILNTSFDAVAVPDPYLVRVYEKSGVYIPVFVVPLGRDFSQFLSMPIKSFIGSPFVFATFNLCDRRKNTLKLVQAFARAFGDNPDIELRLYWRACFDQKYRDQILSEIDNQNLGNVIIHEGPVSCTKHFSRFRKIDCLVNIATGEGFSIQPREAMALGIPVIVTNNTAQSTICASGLVRAVPANIEIPALYPWAGDYGVQYDCNVEDIALALSDMYKNYSDYLRKAPRCRAWAQSYDLTATRAPYISLIKPSRVILGPINALLPDGIMTTSPQLVRKYQFVFKSVKAKKLRASSRSR